MSVRDGLLSILTLGPAYGLQLHAEFMARAPHRRAVNVGQIYGTLDRLAKQGLIHPAGATGDGLPLYALTAAGSAAAAEWMRDPVVASLPEWTEMLDQVLVTSSVDPTAAMRIATAYRRWWDADLAATRKPGPDTPAADDVELARLAREAQGVAALAWLGAVAASIADYDTARPLSPVRPRRGRRPKAAA